MVLTKRSAASGDENVASRDKFDVDTFNKDIQYALEKLGKSKFGFERTAVSNFQGKGHESSGNELVDYSRAPCLGADQKGRGLWFHYLCSQCYAAQHSFVPILSLRRDSPSKIVPDFLCATL